MGHGPWALGPGPWAMDHMEPLRWHTEGAHLDGTGLPQQMQRFGRLQAFVAPGAPAWLRALATINDWH